MKIKSVFIKMISVVVLFCFIPAQAKKVLITGGAGFIGSHVAEALLARHDDVVIIDSLNDYYDPAIKEYNLACVQKRSHGEGSYSFYSVDIENREALSKIFEREQPDVICHLAARAGVRASVTHPELYVTTNIMGTLVLLEVMRDYKIPHIVLASSSSVYGVSTKAPFTEDAVCDEPCSPYAATKRACEVLAYTYYYLYGISCSCLRFFTVYGPRGRPDMAPYKFIKAVYENKPIVQYGDGAVVRDFTYIDDIVDGILRALDRPLDFQIFNLGRGEPLSLSYFIETLAQVTHHKIIRELRPALLEDVPLTYADISKARKMLGYEPRISIHEGLRLTWDWYKHHCSSL